MMTEYLCAFFLKFLKGKYVMRHVGQQGRPLNDNDIQAVMRQNDYRHVMAYSAPQPVSQLLCVLLNILMNALKKQLMVDVSNSRTHKICKMPL